jgi:hypothetical protein
MSLHSPYPRPLSRRRPLPRGIAYGISLGLHQRNCQSGLT